MKRLLSRLRPDDGFGYVEMMIALVILNIGLLALMATFANGVVTIRKAGHSATASTLADSQIELYRALTYSAIVLDSTSIPDTAPYTTDSAYSVSQVTGTCSGQVSSNPQCNASREVTGPDHGTYRIDTYVVWLTPVNGRQVKQVTVVVHDANDLDGRVLGRRSSLFDEATGT